MTVLVVVLLFIGVLSFRVVRWQHRHFGHFSVAAIGENDVGGGVVVTLDGTRRRRCEFSIFLDCMIDDIELSFQRAM
jgi:hypothetical protein